jgi:multiple antibiotic resistance protein
MSATLPPSRGPGAIAATVLLAGRAGGNLTLIAILIGVVVLVAFACFLAFLFAERIGRFLGLTGNIVLSRLLGVLLAALAVQYVVDGARAILNG